MKKHFILSFAVIFCVCALFTTSLRSEAKTTETIADGVYIGTVYVGGMTEEEAYGAISTYVDSLMGTTFTLRGVGDKTIKVSAEKMGISCDPTESVNSALSVTRKGSLIKRYKDSVDLRSEDLHLPLILEVDKEKTARLLYDKQSKLSVKAKNASLERSAETFSFVEGVSGEEVVEEASVYAINQFLAYEFDGTDSEIQLATQVIEARGSEEELACIQDLLGTFSTNYGSSAAGRKTNIKNACSKLNGNVVYPGEEISVHDVIAPLTIENGYAVGGAFLNGQVVDSVGGGVCQVATTLYNALIRAEIDITMRYNHSMIVAYVEPSDDAAIAGDYKDLRFKNNSDYPIFIEGSANGSQLSFRIYGKETRPSNRKVRFESVVVSEEDIQLKATYDSSQPIGYYNVDVSPHKGMQAELYKIVTVDGVETERTLFNKSKYNSGAKQVTIGTSGCSAEQLTAIKNAVAANDEDAVKAEIARASAGYVPPVAAEE